MLDALRRGATGWLAKILFSLLVVSFAVWGIADVFTGVSRGTVAKVGDTEISPDEFQRSMQTVLANISGRAQRRITLEDARAAGLDRQLLARMMEDAAIDAHAAKLNLDLSDEAIGEAVQADPTLRGPDGKFSSALFDNRLRESGLSEQGYITLRRREDIRQQITDALDAALVVPRPSVDALNNWRDETRMIEYFTIDANKVATVADPDAAKLKETYEANKTQFVVPEMRKLGVLVLSLDELAKQMTIGEEEIATEFEKTKDSYGKPEARRVQQIAFKDRAAADNAKRALAEGKSFADIAKDAGAKDSDIDLGLVTRRDLFDPKVAEAAFALEKDKVSDPVEGTFAVVLLRVTAIQPAVVKTLADVKDEVRAKVGKRKAEDNIKKLEGDVEDTRAQGKSLKETADTHKLIYLDIPAVDRTGKTPDGKIAIALKDAAAILESAFDAQAGIEGAVVELPGDGGFAWIDMLGVTEPKQKPLEEVKDQVKELYKSTEQKRLVSALADKLVERSDRGEPLAALAKDAGDVKFEKSEPFRRRTELQGLTIDVANRAFALPYGKAGSAPARDGNSRTVFKVISIKRPPELTPSQSIALAQDMKEGLFADAVSQYATTLLARTDQSVNDKELQRVMGVVPNQ